MSSAVYAAEFDIFIKEVQREMTTKAGQKCTAIRRIIVPENMVEDVQIALGKRLASTVIGDPNVEGVRMGALAGPTQLKEVIEKVELLSKTQKIVFGSLTNFEVQGADKNKGAFMSPILFLNENPFKYTDCHSVEAFGPVSTIMPYKNMDEAIELSKMGKGSLVSSIITANDVIAKEYVLGAASMHGRILMPIVQKKVQVTDRQCQCLFTVDREEQVEEKKWVENEECFIICSGPQFKALQQHLQKLPTNTNTVENISKRTFILSNAISKSLKLAKH